MLTLLIVTEELVSLIKSIAFLEVVNDFERVFFADRKRVVDIFWLVAATLLLAVPTPLSVMANVKVAKRWTVVRQQFNCTTDGKQIENFSISTDVSAELCVRLLSSSCLRNFSGLKTKLQTSSPEWIAEFLSEGGMEVLFQALERLSRGGRMAFVEAFLQLECVNCIKAVMNSKQGLDSMVQNSTLVRNLVEG